MRGLGPMPRAPRKFVRDFDKHGHHRDCDCSHGFWDRYETRVCTCSELDQDDYIAECERRYDAWREGDYADQEEVRDDD